MRTDQEFLEARLRHHEHLWQHPENLVLLTSKPGSNDLSVVDLSQDEHGVLIIIDDDWVVDRVIQKLKDAGVPVVTDCELSALLAKRWGTPN